MFAGSSCIDLVLCSFMVLAAKAELTAVSAVVILSSAVSLERPAKEP